MINMLQMQFGSKNPIRGHVRKNCTLNLQRIIFGSGEEKTQFISELCDVCCFAVSQQNNVCAKIYCYSNSLIIVYCKNC